MSGERGVFRREVITGMAAAAVAGAMTPLNLTAAAHQTASALRPEWRALDAELANKLARFRALRAQALRKLWAQGGLDCVHAYDQAAREEADKETRLVSTALDILSRNAQGPAEEAIVHRAGEAFREYIFPMRDFPAVVQAEGKEA